MAATQSQHDQESLGDIGRQIADDAARLVRMEIELAETGMIESLKRGAIAIALIVVALPLVLIGAAIAFSALPKHFGDVWWSYALTGAGFLLIALLLGGLAGLRIRAMVRTQKQTFAAIKEDVEWVKQLTRRDKSATLTRVALAADIDKLERRIRHELNWKARLRRDGPQIVAIAGAVVVVAVGVVVLRARFGSRGAANVAKAEPTPSIDELARQVRELREELHGKKGDESRPLWQKLAVRGATAGAAAGASMVARRYAQRVTNDTEHAG